MKILISVQHFDPALGGAERSLQTITENLSKEHEVIVIQAGKKESIDIINNSILVTKKVPIYDKYWLFPINFQAKKWKIIIDKEIQNYKPDLIITQLNFAAPTIDIANKYNIPSIIFIRGYEHYCPIIFTKGTTCNRKCQNCLTFKLKLRYPNINEWINWNKRAIINSNIVITNSNFVANITKEWTGITSKTLYPLINLEEYKTNNQNKEYITMLSSSKEKGIDIFLKIVKNTPNEKFLIVTDNNILKIKKYLYKLNNLKIINRTNNMKNIYNKIKILIIPSIWEEPFGRVVIEAGINGIPIIGSHKGGIPEAIGDGGIIINDIFDISLWKKAIDDINKNYDHYSKKAKSNALKFDYDKNILNLKNIIEKLKVI